MAGIINSSFARQGQRAPQGWGLSPCCIPRLTMPLTYKSAAANSCCCTEHRQEQLIPPAPGLLAKKKSDKGNNPTLRNPDGSSATSEEMSLSSAVPELPVPMGNLCKTEGRCPRNATLSLPAHGWDGAGHPHSAGQAGFLQSLARAACCSSKAPRDTAWYCQGGPGALQEEKALPSGLIF